ncbi:anti-sigma factor [Jatrophihabitans telluris]|uniref:Regulator of SigK n=1 Tax=Jatrophihabitans telluris TaxID=2038343 RepID=A0ABY4R121_9ACTN|nr:anti-sigma factor [Jatrophihabitans telluris]UQX89613.1 anti-sigma factor [Jatrophihabitans telluris]
MSPELHALAGPYALDALDAGEREEFERHLDECADCRDEVASYVATAVELTHLSAATPPPALRDAVLHAAAAVRPLAPVTDNVIALRRARGSRSLWQGLAAACALIALVLGTWGFQQHRQATRTTEASAVQSILSARDSNAISGDVGSGHATLVYSKSERKVALIGHNIPAPGADKTYQLWMISGAGGSQHAVSAGTFLPNADGDVTALASGDLAGSQRMGVSVEPAGGSAQPTDVIATMPL